MWGAWARWLHQEATASHSRGSQHCSAKINTPPFPPLSTRLLGVIEGGVGPKRPVSLWLWMSVASKACKNWRTWLVILRKHRVHPKPKTLVVTPGDQRTPSLSHVLKLALAPFTSTPSLHGHMALTATWLMATGMLPAGSSREPEYLGTAMDCSLEHTLV